LSSLSLSRKLPCSCSCPSIDASDDDMPTFELFPLRVGVRVAANSLSGDGPSLGLGSILVACWPGKDRSMLLCRLRFETPLYTSADSHADVNQGYCQSSQDNPCTPDIQICVLQNGLRLRVDRGNTSMVAQIDSGSSAVSSSIRGDQKRELDMFKAVCRDGTASTARSLHCEGSRDQQSCVIAAAAPLPLMYYVRRSSRLYCSHYFASIPYYI